MADMITIPLSVLEDIEEDIFNEILLQNHDEDTRHRLRLIREKLIAAYQQADK